jgi:hypothetical protein
MALYNSNNVDGNGKHSVDDDDDRISVFITSDVVGGTFSSIPHAYGVLSVLLIYL